jgi:hypothetical protein
VTALELVNLRANLLSTTQLLDQVALDRYSFVRDAYLARRRDALYDGAPPMETFDDEETEPPAPAEGTKRVPAKPALLPPSEPACPCRVTGMRPGTSGTPTERTLVLKKLLTVATVCAEPAVHGARLGADECRCSGAPDLGGCASTLPSPTRRCRPAT